MDKLVHAVKKMTIKDTQPPPLKKCKKCPYNIGSDDTGLCATCDPNHVWWKNR